MSPVDRWPEWVLDATLSHDDFYCYVPYDREKDKAITGMTLGGFIPKGAKLIGVIHLDGQEAVEKWCEAHLGWETAHVEK